jgi:hypothetical protein
MQKKFLEKNSRPKKLQTKNLQTIIRTFNNAGQEFSPKDPTDFTIFTTLAIPNEKYGGDGPQEESNLNSLITETIRN